MTFLMFKMFYFGTNLIDWKLTSQFFPDFISKEEKKKLFQT